MSVAEVELHDRRSLLENILGGMLLFAGWHALEYSLSPKNVQWIRFRIDSAQGKNEGLAEIMVYGELYAGGNSAG